MRKCCLWLINLGLLTQMGVHANDMKVPDAVQICTSCHGLGGQGIELVAPSIAGMSTQYLSNQINLFIAGDRHNPVMELTIKNIPEEQIKQVSEYFTAQPIPQIKLQYRGDDITFTTPTEKLVYQGDLLRKIPACVTCHGPSGIGVGPIPRLAAQQMPYLKSQLQAWQRNNRTGDVGNVMATIAKKLDAEEIEALANYFSTLQ